MRNLVVFGTIIVSSLLGYLVWAREFEAAAVIGAGIIGVTIPAALAINRYSRIRREASVTAAAQLLHDVVGCVEEIDDILRRYAPSEYKEVTISPGRLISVEEIRSRSAEKSRRVRELSRRLQAMISTPENMRRTSFDGDISAVEVEIPRLNYDLATLKLSQMYMSTDYGNLSNSALQSTASSDGWEKSLFATSQFFGYREYSRTILGRIISAAENDSNCLTEAGRHDAALIYYYSRLLLLNRYFGPYAIECLGLAYTSNQRAAKKAEIRINFELIKKARIEFQSEFGSIFPELSSARPNHS